ncbi:MAG TPA: hypothetical protein VFO30_07395 [Chthoniobacterales bacterium]|nr:hypothetical protein [Chthoniobacterales bacterium]
MKVLKVKRVIRKASAHERSTMGAAPGEFMRHYFTHESWWHFAIEALVFAALAAISAWPIFAAIDAMSKFLPGVAG